MTTLTPDELRDARDAWMLVQLGKPVPTQYRPAAMKVALHCFRRGYDHDEPAGPRPLFLHPDGGREGKPGVYGANRTWSPTQLAGWLTKATGAVRPKGTGPMVSPGHSHRGDDHDADGVMIAGPRSPLPPLQRGDERCRSVGWLFLDADDVGEWDALLGAVGASARGRVVPPAPASLAEHVEALAAGELEGRRSGTPGGERAAERGGGVRERVFLRDHYPQLALREQRPDVGAERGRERDLAGIGACAQRRWSGRPGSWRRARRGLTTASAVAPG